MPGGLRDSDIEELLAALEDGNISEDGEDIGDENDIDSYPNSKVLLQELDDENVVGEQIEDPPLVMEEEQVPNGNLRNSNCLSYFIGRRLSPAAPLLFLTVGSSFKSLAFNCRMGYSTVRSIVHETCAAIWKVLQPIVMPKPTEETWSQIEEGFKNIWQFPNCIGALDGKHVQIRSPHNSGSHFYKYKKTFSTVLLAIIDANYRFVIVDVGGYGRNSDGGILSNSKLGQKLHNSTLHIPQNKCLPSTNKEMLHLFVANEAFPLTNNILRPFPGNVIRDDEQKKKSIID